MRIKSVKQFAIVTGDSAQTFSETLNEKLKELEDKDITVEFYEHFLGARISWSERTGYVPECLGEEYEIQGAGFICKQCPMYQDALKADGTTDNRAKFGRCMMKSFAKVNGGQRACEKLYQMITEGEVQLCLSK